MTALLALPGLSEARAVGYRVEFVNGFGCHVVQINLGSPKVKVTPILSLRFPGGAEPMMSLCRREQPSAAVTGTFFSKTTLLPVGDIVIDGRLEYFGGMGSAIALTPENEVAFERLPYGRRWDWGPFESVLACGPLLVERGEVALAPRHEHFQDPHVLGRASRTAVGLTPMNKLLMVVTREQVSLWELAKIMRSLGCIEAINLDGGSSTGMYYRGSAIVRPARSLVNMLAVYEDVPRETRTCLCELPDERSAIYRYRAAKAYEVYMRAQVPLALGKLEEAVRLLNQATQLDHLNASYQVRLASTLARRGDDPAASVAYARAAEILTSKGHHEEALARLQSALEHDPGNRLARRALPAAYRAVGMEMCAEVAEYEWQLSEMQRRLVATHADLMTEMTERAFALAGTAPEDLRGPALAGVCGERTYVDSELGVRLALPACWYFTGPADPSALLAQHRFQPMLVHLRAVRVPAGVSLERLVDLYWEGSFQEEIIRAPVVGPALGQEVQRARTLSSDGGVYCQTVFAVRGELLWVLSMATTEDLRDAASTDFAAIAEGLTFF
ncbi:MAG: phosphodiester glycosidase family protein [Armatimonadota bacterium]|nr:phosphodiester glycosidase family protein [Armatimonadota bacterium]